MQLSFIASAVIADAWYWCASDPCTTYAAEAPLLTADDAEPQLTDPLCRPPRHPHAPDTTQATTDLPGSFPAHTGSPNAGNRPSSHPLSPDTSRNPQLSIRLES